MTNLLDDAERLYCGVVTDPEKWNEQARSDWAGAISTTTSIDKVAAKHLRRIVRMAGKLQQFWETDPRRTDATIDWHSRVDIALGPRAWRPMLELATHLLDEHPSEDLFDRAGELFRVVNRVEWMDGVTYQEWRGGNQRK